MSLERVTVNGKSGLAAEVWPGMLKIVFDDGSTVFSVPVVKKADVSEEERDDHGRWTAGGGGSSSNAAPLTLKRTKERAWDGEPVELQSKPSKQAAGHLGEQIAQSYMMTEGGMPDAHMLNSEVNNFPVDMLGDHEMIEVKAGLASNSDAAQQWRATIGQPGPSETEWLKTASKEDKRDWNAKKQQAILDRKDKAVDDYSKKLDTPMQGKTFTSIINPDTKIADVYLFDGFHSRIGWSSAEAKKAYLGSFKYE